MQQSVSGLSVQAAHHSYRLGGGKHYQLVDESTSIGPFNGALFAWNMSQDGSLVPGQASPYVSYLESPDTIAISNVTRWNAGNYSCLGYNGAANSSKLSPARPIYVKCKHYLFCLSHKFKFFSQFHQDQLNSFL